MESEKNEDVLKNFNSYNYVGKNIIETQLETKDTPSIEDTQIKGIQEAPFIKPVSNDKFQSVSLPSNFIFYNFKEIKVRKFEIRDLAKMHKVAQNQSHKLFKEVIQSCIDVDINLLTPGDFKYLCYWLRLNSYTKTPMHVEWRSKYGNENIALVLKDELTTLAPEITKEQLEDYLNKGLCVPTLKFSDIFDTELSADDDFLYTNAQYFQGETWEEKISNMEDFLNKNGLEALNETRIFDNLIEHGVQEEVTVIDSKFDPSIYCKTLEEKINRIKLTLNNIVDPEIQEAAMLNVLLKQFEKEYLDLSKKIELGEDVQADPEVIFLEMDTVEFLSPLLNSINK